MKRIQTGIKGFDRLVEGGFPERSNVVICGAPGTCKTIFCLEYLYHGAKEFNEPGVYVSIEQNETDLIEQAERFGYDIKELIKKDKMSIMYIPLERIKRDFIERIRAEVLRIGAKRLVMDSLSLLALESTFFHDKKVSLIVSDTLTVAKSLSEFVYNIIHLLEDLQTTTLFVNNTKMDSYETRDQISEFVCDGMIVLRARSMGRMLIRTLEIMKMRKTSIVGGINAMKITGTGLEVEQNEKN